MAVRDGNRVERLHVLDDGSTSLIEALVLRPIAQAQAFTKPAFIAALVFLGLGWIPVWGRGLHLLLGVAFYAAIAGAVVMKLYTSVVTSTWTRRVGRGWNQPTNLNGWVPRSSAQIAAVETIAETHGGAAWVYDQGREPLIVRGRSPSRFWYRWDYWCVEDDGFSTKQARFVAVDGIDDSHEWIKILTCDPKSD